MRASLVVLLVIGCGRVNFGYPLVPCEEVVSIDSVLGADDHCYTRHDGPQSHGMAGVACASLGGHLAAITSPDEQASILALGLTAPSRIGLSNRGAGNTQYHWTTDEPVPFTSWAAAQPTPCMLSDATTALMDATGEWTTACDNAGQPFVCEIPPWLVRDDGHAYRVAWAGQDWLSARNTCESMGAHLATITSADERAFVSKLVTVELWIDAQVTAAGAMTWSTGEPVEFTAWASGQPNEAADACVFVKESQEWVDTPCDSPRRALCERDE